MAGLGKKIKKIRELRNYSQEYMASQLALSQPAYSALESGKTRIDEKKLEQIALVFQISPEFILNFSEDQVFQKYISEEEHHSRIREIEQLHDLQIRQKEDEISMLRRSLNL
jgi:transcriptional regulator with XRE-family HTH domain